MSRLKDGRIGRFGWKAQTATLKEFVLSAAAGEMGLEVPGRRQAADPRLPGFVATGLDMDEAECDALTDYVRSLPMPIAIEPDDDRESMQRKSGEEAFKSIGCAQCHLPKLGGIDGMYSDLLLHDMSPGLGDSDAYSVFVGDAPRAAVARRPDRSGTGTSTIHEWRTPPLWGLRDSGPYLHDGRAASIDQAIAMHGGQGASSARRYAELPPVASGTSPRSSVHSPLPRRSDDGEQRTRQRLQARDAPQRGDGSRSRRNGVRRARIEGS